MKAATMEPMTMNGLRRSRRQTTHNVCDMPTTHLELALSANNGRTPPRPSISPPTELEWALALRRGREVVPSALRPRTMTAAAVARVGVGSARHAQEARLRVAIRPRRVPRRTAIVGDRSPAIQNCATPAGRTPLERLPFPARSPHHDGVTGRPRILQGHGSCPSTVRSLRKDGVHQAHTDPGPGHPLRTGRARRHRPRGDGLRQDGGLRASHLAPAHGGAPGPLRPRHCAHARAVLPNLRSVHCAPTGFPALAPSRARSPR